VDASGQESDLGRPRPWHRAGTKKSVAFHDAVRGFSEDVRSASRSKNFLDGAILAADG
jgi:hypothetical protein